VPPSYTRRRRTFGPGFETLRGTASDSFEPWVPPYTRRRSHSHRGGDAYDCIVRRDSTLISTGTQCKALPAAPPRRPPCAARRGPRERWPRPRPPCWWACTCCTPSAPAHQAARTALRRGLGHLLDGAQRAPRVAEAPQHGVLAVARDAAAPRVLLAADPRAGTFILARVPFLASYEYIYENTPVLFVLIDIAVDRSGCRSGTTCASAQGGTGPRLSRNGNTIWAHRLSLRIRMTLGMLKGIRRRCVLFSVRQRNVGTVSCRPLRAVCRSGTTCASAQGGTGSTHRCGCVLLLGSDCCLLCVSYPVAHSPVHAGALGCSEPGRHGCPRGWYVNWNMC
jgi:hypothetical protein